MLLSYHNRKVYYNVYGEGPVLVLLHGLMENSQMWEPFISDLSTNYKVITVDLPGHGQTDNFDAIHTMELMAEVVQQVLQKEGVTKIYLVGHSMGGYVALAYLEMYKEKVRGILLLNSTAREDSLQRKIDRDKAVQVAEKHKEKYIRASFGNLFSPTTKEEHMMKIKHATEQALTTSLQGITAAHKGMKVRRDYQQMLSDYDGEKYLAIGTYEEVYPVKSLKEEAQKTKSKIIFLESGHMAPIEDPEGVVKLFKLLN